MRVLASLSVGLLAVQVPAVVLAAVDMPDNPSAIPVWLNVFANFGGFGVLAYYFIYRKPHEDREARHEMRNERQTIELHRQEEEVQMRQAFLDEAEKQRQYDRERSTYERQRCEDHQVELKRVFESQIEQLVKVFEGGQKQVIAMLEAMAAGYKVIGDSGILKANGDPGSSGIGLGKERRQ